MPLGLSAALLIGLWAGPLPELARVSFSAHMALHLAIVVIVAPLLTMALRLAATRRVQFGAGAAIAVSAVELLVVWGWHAPLLHAAAALRPSAFVLQQASFLAAGVLVWLPGLLGSGRRAGAAGAIAMTASFTHMTMLGVLLASAPGLVYDPGLCGGAFGLDALMDQRLGGAMMAAFGGLAYLAGAVWFTKRLLSD